MATTKISPKDVVEAVKDWSLMDIMEFVKSMEETYGIKAAAAVAAAPAAAAVAEAEPEEEQTEFTVLLSGIGQSKINVIKAVREITQLGLKEAKDLVDATPKNVLENVSKEDADKAAAKLREAGAEVEVK